VDEIWNMSDEPWCALTQEKWGNRPSAIAPECQNVFSFMLPAALRAAQICRYLVYSEAEFEVFRPAGATRCTDGG